MRLKSRKASTRKDANRPSEFQEIRQPKVDFIAVPLVTSENREYVPMALLSKNIIINNRISFVADGSLSTFGLLMSKPFNVWNNAISGRLEMRTLISNNLTYNNFPIPTLTSESKSSIGAAAQKVIDARDQFPSSTLADLYDAISMPPNLRKAHNELDLAVMKAFGMRPSLDEEGILSALFKRYEESTRGLP